MVAVTAALQLGGAALSAVGSAQAARQASKSQAAASQAAAAGVSHAQDTQAFYQRQFKRNDALYKRSERNRARILENITPQKIESQSRQRLTRSRQQMISRIKARAAARGVSNSGLTEYELFQADAQFAELDSQLRLDAEKQALDILASGIAPGLNREAQLNQAIGGASNAVVGAYGTQANTNLNIAGQQLNTATSLGQAAGALAGIAGGSKGAPNFADLVGSLGGGS